MVVDHVQNHAKPVAVRRVDEALQGAGTAVARLDGVGIDAVVTPIAIAGKLGHRHDLDGGDAEFFQCGEPRNDRVKRALRRESADVQLVDDQIFAWNAPPIVVGPAIVPRREDGRRAMHAVGLPAGGGIGILLAVGQSVDVAQPILNLLLPDARSSRTRPTPLRFRRGRRIEREPGSPCRFVVPRFARARTRPAGDRHLGANGWDRRSSEVLSVAVHSSSFIRPSRFSRLSARPAISLGPDRERLAGGRLL